MTNKLDVQAENDAPAIVTIGGLSTVRCSEIDKIEEELTRLNQVSLEGLDINGVASRGAKLIAVFISVFTKELVRKPRAESVNIALGMSALLGRALGIVLINMAQENKIDVMLDAMMAHVYKVASSDIKSFLESKYEGGKA